MKLQPDRMDGVNAISRLEPGRVWVNADAWSEAVIVPWDGPVTPWGVVGHASLKEEHFARLLSLGPEIVIFGSGASLRFVHPSLLSQLYERRVGVETMDTSAACRTYNVLAGEGRRVVAALLVAAAA